MSEQTLPTPLRDAITRGIGTVNTEGAEAAKVGVALFREYVTHYFKGGKAGQAMMDKLVAEGYDVKPTSFHAFAEQESDADRTMDGFVVPRITVKQSTWSRMLTVASIGNAEAVEAKVRKFLALPDVDRPTIDGFTKFVNQGKTSSRTSKANRDKAAADKAARARQKAVDAYRSHGYWQYSNLPEMPTKDLKAMVEEALIVLAAREAGVRPEKPKVVARKSA